MSERHVVSRVVVAPLSAATDGITVTSSGTNTKGSYTELLAGADLPFDVHEIWLMNYGTATTGTDTGYAIDFAVGAAASEVILIPDILVGFRSALGGGHRFPVFIPAGTRTAIRGQSRVSADATFVVCYLVGGSPWGNPEIAGSGVYTTYGFTAATTRGTNMSAAGTAHVKGAWSQLTASTTRGHSIIVPSFQLLDNVAADASYRVDIGVGGSGSEIVIIPDIWLRGSTLEEIGGPLMSPMSLVKVPAGSRLATRCQSSIVSDSNLNVAVHCS